MSWFQVWLFLHIAGAIVAFGPAFVFPVIEQLQEGHPQALAFVSMLGRRIETRLILPFAASMVVSGTGLIVTSQIDVVRTPWLLIALALYAGAMVVALSLLPGTARLVRLTAPAGGPPLLEPTPEILALQRRAQIAGILLTVLLALIVGLMVFRPGS
jgi:hypothetical protein